VTKAKDTHQCGLYFEEFLFAFVLCLSAVSEGFLQKDKVAPKFHLTEHEPAQGLEGVAFLVRKFARSYVDDANRTERITVLVDERSSRIETNMRFRNHEWIIAKAFVL
jgi:hypothetical protein